MPGAFTERYNRYRQNRADGIRQSIEAWNEENKKLARSYGEHSGEFIKARSDALRTSGESLKQRIKDSGLYDDDTVTALGEGIDSWSTAWDDAYNEYVRKSTVGADRKKAAPTAEHGGGGGEFALTAAAKGNTLEEKIQDTQANIKMLEIQLEKSKGKGPSPEQLMSGDAGIDGNDEIKAALKEKKKELEQLLKERQESEIAEWREENGLSDSSHVPSSPAQDVEAVLSAKSEYFNPDDNKDVHGNDTRFGAQLANTFARAGDRVKEAGDLAMSAFSAGMDRSIAGIGDAARTAYETVKGTAQRLAGVNQIPELKKYSPAAPEAKNL